MSATRTIDDNDVWKFNNGVVLNGGVVANVGDKSSTSYADPNGYQPSMANDRWLVVEPNGTLKTIARYNKRPLLRLFSEPNTYIASEPTPILWNTNISANTYGAWPYVFSGIGTTVLSTTVLYGPVLFQLCMTWFSSTVTTTRCRINVDASNDGGPTFTKARISLPVGFAEGTGCCMVESGIFSTAFHIYVQNDMPATGILNMSITLSITLV